MKFLLAVIGVFTMLNVGLVEELTADQIVKKSEDKLKGKSSFAHMTMDIIRPDWNRSMSLKAWAIGEEFSLVLVTAPAKDKGTVSLKRQKELWSWLPTVERIIKVSPSMMSQSWMGSDFTNDDLLKQSSIVNDYSKKILTTDTVSGLACYKLELNPKENAVVVWGKVVMWVDKVNFNQMQVKFYDEDMDLVNTLHASNIKMLGGKMLPATLEMIPVNKKGHKTRITYSSLRFDITETESFFSKQNMRKVK